MLEGAGCEDGGEEHDCCGEVGGYCHCGEEGFGVGEGDGLCGRCG